MYSYELFHGRATLPDRVFYDKIMNMTNKKQYSEATVKLVDINFDVVQDLPSGSHTAPKIVRLPGGELAVLKLPVQIVQRNNETSDDFERRKSYILQDWARDIAKQNSISEVLTDFDGSLNIPRVIKYVPGQQGYIIEQLASGQDLSASGIKNMSSDARAKLAKELAFFLNYTHQKTASQKPAQYSFYSRLDTKDKSASQKVCEFFTKHIPGQSDLLNDLFSDTLTWDNFTVMTHSDIRAANILYDADTNNFSLIDFGNSKYGNKYHDMVLFAAAANKELFPILLQCAKIYNSLPKEKHQIYYDLNTIRKLFCRNIVFLAGYHAITNNYNDVQTKEMWAESVLPDLNYINRTYDDFMYMNDNKIFRGQHDK